MHIRAPPQSPEPEVRSHGRTAICTGGNPQFLHGAVPGGRRNARLATRSVEHPFARRSGPIGHTSVRTGSSVPAAATSPAATTAAIPRHGTDAATAIPGVRPGGAAGYTRLAHVRQPIVISPADRAATRAGTGPGSSAGPGWTATPAGADGATASSAAARDAGRRRRDKSLPRCTRPVGL